MKTILIGFGDIAEKYIPVLTELNCDIIGVVGRDYKKTLEKSRKLGISNVFKSIENIPVHECDFLMNLTSADSISSTLKQIISLKKPIFTEKPIGFGVEEITNLINENKKFNSRIMVGTNRRFYSIFHKALKFLQEQDKKIESIRIDAPERFTDINNKKFNQNIRNNWMFANSIHCVDLIRFFGGDIKKIESNSIPNKYNFKANGICENDINFSYSSDWKKQSKWNISIFADEIKIIFEPIEKGKIIMKNDEIDIVPSNEDLKFKPGFHAQLSYFMQNFVKKDEKKWPGSDLKDHKKSVKLVENIFQ
jgi:predicted dehydrogenase